MTLRGRRIKIFRLAEGLIAFGILFGLTTPGIARETVPAIASEYPPYLSSTPGENFSGELAQAAFQKSGVDLAIDYYPLKRYGMLGDQSATPVLLGDTSHLTEERLKTLSTVPILTIRLVLMYYKPAYPQGISYETLDDLKPYRIGQVLGSASEDIFKAANIEAETSQLEGVIRKLQSKRIDLGVVADLSGIMLVKKLFPEEIENFGYLEKTLITFPGSILFDRKHPKGEHAETLFRQGFQALKQEGKHRDILEKYYGNGQIPLNVLQFYREDSSH